MINDFQKEAMDRRSTLKREIKKTGGNCARILLILGILVYVIGFAIILGIKSNGIILGINIVSNPETNIAVGFSRDARNFLIRYFPCIIGDIIAIIIAMKTTKIKFKIDIFGRNKSPKMFVLLGALSCIGTGMISSIIYTIYSTILKIQGITIPEPDFSFPGETLYLILFLTYACFLGPILEEIIFRGFILKSMQKYGNLTAIIVSSILFSMFHLNLVQFVNPVLMGIVLGFIAIKSKSILPSIIAHIFNNSIAFIALGISLLKMPVLEILFGSAYFVIGVLALSLFIFKYKKDFIEVIKEDNRILKTYEKVKYAFSGKWALTYIAFYVIFVVGSLIETNIMSS